MTTCEVCKEVLRRSLVAAIKMKGRCDQCNSVIDDSHKVLCDGCSDNTGKCKWKYCRLRETNYDLPNFRCTII